MEWVLAIAASFCAGLIDAIVGGGGLILLPALFALFPHTPPATLFGTNKSASVWGTAMAVSQYARRVSVNWTVMLPGAMAALVGGFLGAWHVTLVDPGFLRKLLPFVLGAVFAYTLLKKEMGQVHAPHSSLRRARVLATLIGAVLGWYDGFFGPGTGSFLMIAMVRIMGFDFLHASVNAKILNLATNLAALTLFGLKGHVMWPVGLVMAVANVTGAFVGVRLALRHGSGFVRKLFIVVVGSLILKTLFDAYLK